MIPVPRREHKLLVAIHGWSGISLGLLLLVIVMTGTVAVLGDEIGHWSAGTLATRSPLASPIDKIAGQVFEAIPPTAFKRVDLSASTLNNLTVSFRGDSGPGERGVIVELGPDGRVQHRREGLMRDIADAEPAGALENFLVDLHVRLYIPDPWGSMITGIAGLAMMVAALSGFFIHRHLFTDIFTIRKKARPVLARRDQHGVAAAWLLPFAVILAFTGSYLSFAGSVGVPALAWVSFGGDQHKLIAVLDGTPAPTDPTPVRGANLDGVMADAIARTGRDPDFLQVTNPGRADAAVEVTMKTGDGALTSTTLSYKGLTGRFLGERPNTGRVPSAGGTAMSVMGPLHFGAFGGFASKLAWVALGFATCFVIVSGIRLWLERRTLTGAVWIAFGRATSVAAFGLPFSMGTAAVAFFVTPTDGDPGIWTAIGFLIGAALALAAACRLERPTLDRWLRVGAGALLIILPLLRHGFGGPGWRSAWAAGQPIIMIGDLAVVLVGLTFLAEPLQAWWLARTVTDRSGLQQRTQ